MLTASAFTAAFNPALSAASISLERHTTVPDRPFRIIPRLSMCDDPNYGTNEIRMHLSIVEAAMQNAGNEVWRGQVRGLVRFCKPSLNDVYLGLYYGKRLTQSSPATLL